MHVVVVADRALADLTDEQGAVLQILSYLVKVSADLEVVVGRIRSELVLARVHEALAVLLPVFRLLVLCVALLLQLQFVMNLPDQLVKSEALWVRAGVLRRADPQSLRRIRKDVLREVGVDVLEELRGGNGHALELLQAQVQRNLVLQGEVAEVVLGILSEQDIHFV